MFQSECFPVLSGEAAVRRYVYRADREAEEVRDVAVSLILEPRGGAHAEDGGEAAVREEGIFGIPHKVWKLIFVLVATTTRRVAWLAAVAFARGKPLRVGAVDRSVVRG